MNGPFDELPFRDITAESECLRLMAERGETVADVLWVVGGPMRAADATHNVMRTRKHLYTLAWDDWEGDGAYVVRVFVSPI